MPNPRFQGLTDQQIIDLLEERLAAAHRENQVNIKKLELIEWFMTSCMYPEIAKGNGGSPWRSKWVIALNPMNGTGPQFFYNKDFWKVIELAKENYAG